MKNIEKSVDFKEIKSISVLMLHNRYQYSGGEDISTIEEVEMLKNHGQSIELWECSNDQIKSFSLLDKTRLFFSSSWDTRSADRISKKLRDNRPDVLHVQNFFPLLSPSVHSAARQLAIPTVQHLRNFRLGCLNAYLFREGEICEDCIGRNPWRGVQHRCYRSSLPASASVWQMLTFHRWRKTWQDDVDVFVTPSQFAANKLVEIGIPPEKLNIKPDFLADPLSGGTVRPFPVQPTFVFAGRLSSEKGLLFLLEAWRLVARTDWRLEIVGTGPEEPLLHTFCQEKGLQNVHFHGQVPPTQLSTIIQHSSLLLVPSLWYETFGRVVIEAFACGRGAMVSNLGALAELIDENVNGCTIPAGNAQTWAERILWCGENLSALRRWGKMARQHYEQLFTPDVNYRMLMEIYGRVLTG